MGVSKPATIMPVFTYRYGEAAKLQGLSIGVTRHLPRGVKKTEYASRGYFDVWLPTLAPSAELVGNYLHGDLSFARFAASYRRELKQPEARHTLDLLAAVAQNQRINIGCFCEDPATCHRTLLAEVLAEAGAPVGEIPKARRPNAKKIPKASNGPKK